MLNCCIEHKKKREQLHKGYTGDVEDPPASPFRGPSTSQVSRSLSHEDVMEDSDNISQSEACAISSNSRLENKSNKKKSNVNKMTDGPRRKSGEGRPASTRIASSSESSDEEFFECNDENNTENLADEKDIDTATDENQEGENVENDDADTENQSGSEMDCDPENINEAQTGSVNGNSTSVAGSGSVGNVSILSDSVFKESYSHKPEGRLAPFLDLKLINCDEKMYIPVTQEPAPMTEDMLEEHAEVLAK